MGVRAGEIAALAYVTRAVSGKIATTTVKFDPKKGENVRKDAIVEDPVVVFFLNGSSQVFSYKSAEARGFLKRPEILNFGSVDDADTIVGKFKFAIMPEERIEYWQQMEQEIINRCIRRGLPIPTDCTIDKNSLFVRSNSQLEGQV